MTREQIIDLINQYIYTNGNQRITATQLNEILLEIANAFAMEGGGGGGAGIDPVLEAGNEVTAGRTIVNENGGSFLLDASFTVEGTSMNYMGLDVSTTQYQSVDYLLDRQVTIGTLKRSNPSRNIFNMSRLPILLKGEVLAATSYISENPDEDVDPGIYATVVDYSGRGLQRITASSVKSSVTVGPDADLAAHQKMEAGEIELSVTDNESFATLNLKSDAVYSNVEQTEEIYTQMYALQGQTGNRTASGSEIADHKLEPNAITAEVVNGPQSSLHQQYTNTIFSKVSNGSVNFISEVLMDKQTWSNETGNIGEINHSGIKLENGKSFSMVSTGSSELLFKAEGPNASIRVNGSTTTSLGLNANYIGLMDGSNVYGSLGYDACQLLTAFTVTRAGSASIPSITSSHTGTADNVAVYANAINGTTNTAFLADNGNLVVKNGSAMVGFGSDVTPDARLDIKAQGATASDLALRVRNSANTSNILEVRGDGDVMLGSGLLTAGTDLYSTLIHGFTIDGCRVGSDMGYQGTDQYHYGRIHLRGADFDTEGTNVINIANGTAPTTDNEDAFRLYSADQKAGNAVPHFRTENGAVIKIYQETTEVGDATFSTVKGTPLTDNDRFDGYTLKQIVKALRNLGLLE